MNSPRVDLLTRGITRILEMRYPMLTPAEIQEHASPLIKALLNAMERAADRKEDEAHVGEQTTGS